MAGFFPLEPYSDNTTSSPPPPSPPSPSPPTFLSSSPPPAPSTSSPPPPTPSPPIPTPSPPPITTPTPVPPENTPAPPSPEVPPQTTSSPPPPVPIGENPAPPAPVGEVNPVQPAPVGEANPAPPAPVGEANPAVPIQPGNPAPPADVFAPPGDAQATTPTPFYSNVNGTSEGPAGAYDSSITTDSNSISPSPSPSSGSAVVVVGGVLGAAVFLLALVILGLVCSRKKKRKNHYQNDQYYNKGTHYNQAPVEHVVNLTPKAGTPTGGGVVPVWGSSSDTSSGISGQNNQNQQSINPAAMGGYSSQNQFGYQELAAATNGFSQENLLGQGGFGYVHKGVLSNGTVVAVKSLKSGSGQGEREFQAEVEIISRVHHRHLVSLVGYCIADAQRMLVYQFVPNQTLEHHLHGKGVPVMDWSCRIRIALGSAKGLAYLHEDCHPRIIHRDIKAANILLDDNYEAMVADFGLAKLSSDNFTHVSTRVMGTFGYLAPEYASSGKLSEKSDVFSFGVMLLELITGRKPVDHTNNMMDDSLVDWSRPLMAKALEDGNYDAIADPRMEGNYVPYEMARMVACASASVRHSAKRRPRMSQIVRSLEGDIALEDLNEGVKHLMKPTNNNNNAPSPSTSSHDSTYDTVAYNADMLKFRKMVMTNSQETPVTTTVFDT